MNEEYYNNIEYSWEVVNKFNWKFLPKAFPNTYIHKFAVGDDYHLVHVKDTYYDVKISEVKKKEEDNQIMTTDAVKNKIIMNIVKNLKETAKATINNGMIYFDALGWTFRVKIIKKAKDFDPKKVKVMNN